MTSQDARTYMEQAIEVMRNSIPEPRDDGKVSPTVGAVLVRSDGAVDTACRGELRNGDHAEYTLLERKNRDRKLDGDVLFATLEPCAPGARRHPKLGCAERIAIARIEEVWIGIEDPDPTVARKGIEHLRAAGITIHMFDADLQEVIRQDNEAFLKQALQRAAETDAKPKVVALSTLEGALANVSRRDFSDEALEAYRKTVGIQAEVGSDAFEDRLVRQGLAVRGVEGGVVTPTGFGFLLFGNEPRTVLPQAGLLGTIFDAEETRDGSAEPDVQKFDGPLVLIPELALDWLRGKLFNPIDRTQAQRREVNAPLFELVREGIVNALVHRDYTIAGAKCQLVVTPDAIVIQSPGQPVDPITLEQVKAFDAPMLSRNPILHYVFAQMKLAEERGLGLRSMRVRAVQAGLPLPTYTWKDPYLILTLYRGTKGAPGQTTTKVTLNEEERRGLDFLAGRDKVSRQEYQEALNFDSRKAQRHLQRFVDIGLVERTGQTRATRYSLRGT